MKILLASNSPRRKELLAGLDIPYEVHVIKGIDESYPKTLPAKDVAEYIAQKKASAYTEFVTDDTIVLTADTVVVVGEEIMGKPHDRNDAYRMLSAISGRTHQVYTGVCILSMKGDKHFTVKTDVTFRKLTDEEIYYYIDTYKPMDKAGAYGIQEWIGYVGVTRLEGSYFNVMGLPVQRIYDELKLAHLL